MKRKGFTLTELLVTMVVIGILSAFAIPNISGIIKNNRDEIFLMMPIDYMNLEK